MKKAVKIKIKGNIPAMFFCNYIKENAEKLNLKGFVREINGGSSELVVEGDIECVDKMGEICRQGPKNAVIKDITINEISFQDFKEFKVLHI